MIEFGYAPDPFPWDVLDENCDPWFRLYYMPRESAYLQVDDRSVELKSKHLHLIPPRLKFRYDLNYKAPHLWLHFFSEELTQVLPKEVFSIPFDNTDLFTPIIYNMQKERAENSEATLEVNLLCRSLLNYFFLEQSFLKNAQGLGIPAPLRQAAEYIRDNCCDRISMEEAAAIARMTPIQFKRHFFKYYNVNPKEYHCSARIDYAKTLLMQTELSTKEIAEKCGFSNCYHFYHQFKKNTLITPSQYRSFNKIKH